jgi:hypothetical protein
LESIACSSIPLTSHPTPRNDVTHHIAQVRPEPVGGAAADGAEGKAGKAGATGGAAGAAIEDGSDAEDEGEDDEVEGEGSELESEDEAAEPVVVDPREMLAARKHEIANLGADILADPEKSLSKLYGDRFWGGLFVFVG